MKQAFNFCSNSLAGLTGRVILYSYQLYASHFCKRSDYADMVSRLPVKREIILFKGQRKNKNFVFTLN
jgi:hypothetical protein